MRSTHSILALGPLVWALSVVGGTAHAQSAPQASQKPEATRSQDQTPTIIVTARRIEEDLQKAPLPVTVVSGALLDDSGAFNVERLKEIVPTVQFYSSNPRNSAINIRGLGSPFGLTNDGIEQGVGVYIDGVYFARPASATLDFIDVGRIEVLRGPQGTLFGKNTTSGAFNIITREPSFTPGTRFELSYGNLGFTQAKASITGPLSDDLAARLSFSGTKRDGVLTNTRTQSDLNDLDNLGVRGALLYKPRDDLKITLAGDYTRQRPQGYAQVVAGVAPTLRAANRQWPAIATALGYAPPSYNAFDRLSDADTPHRSYQDLGGASLTVDWDVGAGSLTSISAYRYWDWDPSSDRDFVGLPITTISANPSEQKQWTQELRYAGRINDKASFVVGVFGFKQTIKSDGKQQQGAAAARALLAPSAAAATPGLLDGYGQLTKVDFENESAALFGQLEWDITDKLRILPGLRYNWDRKKVDYRATVYGGLQTSDPALIALQRSVLAPQAYAKDVSDTNLSGQLTIAYQATPHVNAYATYATSFKSVGLNLNGVPNDAAGNPALDAATVKPEDVKHYELGLKTQFGPLTANLAVFDTEIGDYQTNVVNAQVGVLRGYLANAEKARSRGAELDANARLGKHWSLYGALAYTDAEYVSFKDAPPPLEETGGPQVKNISGGRLPGISKWSGSFGAEYTHAASFLGREGEGFAALDTSYRSSFSSSPSPSKYLNVEGYGLLNGRIGFRAASGWDAFLWGRNLLDEEYYEFLTAQPGNSGLYVGLPGDPRTYGVTLRGSF